MDKYIVRRETSTEPSEEVPGLIVWRKIVPGKDQANLLTWLNKHGPYPRSGKYFNLTDLWSPASIAEPEWYQMWSSNQWSKFQVFCYEGSGTGYEAKQEPGSFGDEIGVLVLGDEYVHRWTRPGHATETLIALPRGSTYTIMNEARQRWSYALPSRPMMIRDSRKQCHPYKRNKLFKRYELVFYATRYPQAQQV